jgi:hypothetical protein
MPPFPEAMHRWECRNPAEIAAALQSRHAPLHADSIVTSNYKCLRIHSVRGKQSPTKALKRCAPYATFGANLHREKIDHVKQ